MRSRLARPAEDGRAQPAQWPQEGGWAQFGAEASKASAGVIGVPPYASGVELQLLHVSRLTDPTFADMIVTRDGTGA